MHEPNIVSNIEIKDCKMNYFLIIKMIIEQLNIIKKKKRLRLKRAHRSNHKASKYGGEVTDLPPKIIWCIN